MPDTHVTEAPRRRPADLCIPLDCRGMIGHGAVPSRFEASVCCSSSGRVSIWKCRSLETGLSSVPPTNTGEVD